MLEVEDEFLTSEEAYRAMFCFLSAYYHRTKSDEIGGLLGSLAISGDGKPMDEAMLLDWQEAIEAALRDPKAAHQSFLDQDETRQA